MNKEAYEDFTGLKVTSTRDNFKSLCPIHSESTPSFFIHKETDLCHCFGCGARGYIDIVLAKAYEESPQKIRHILGIKAADRLKRRVDPPEEAFSEAYLAGFKRISMHPFLKKRGFKPDTIHMHSARWDPEGRIVFPLQSIGSNTVLGAAGRTVKDHDKKWYFYWNTRPGNIVYQALDTLQLNILVEGIFDVMWLNQHGYQGAAALLSASATKKQIEIIKANSNELLLFLDNDEAGRIGQTKLAKALKDIRVFYAVYPEGKKDPQELTKEELDIAIGNRKTHVEYVRTQY